MKNLRKLLVSILKIKNYLKLVSKTYIRLTNLGFLKKSYPELFFIDKIVQSNWICVDIGANLGYYSNRIARNLKSGKLVAVEPIPLFNQIWKANLKKIQCPNELLSIALGEKNQTVQMSIPIVNGLVRHGLTRIDKTPETNPVKAMSFSVEMKNSALAFAHLPKIDFIKIDIEGHEFHALNAMREMLDKNRPIVQAELGGTENRSNTLDLFTDLKFKPYKLFQGNLLPISTKELFSLAQDFYFIPQEKENKLTFISN
jgi:FkbM family methyltransferase